MPMIEFRFNREKIPEHQAAQLCADFEGALRVALREVRPLVGRDDYNVFVEGDPFRAQSNQPDLRIYVFYHPSWNFSEAELAELPKTMERFLSRTLGPFGLVNVEVTIRFYRRDGYAGTSFSV